jgi:transposase-like protein
MSLPTIQEIGRIMVDEEECIQFLIDNDILTVDVPCPECGHAVSRHGKKLRCKARDCRKAFSLLRGTFFQKSRLPINTIMLISYFLLAGTNYKTIMICTGVSKDTICNWGNFFRELLALDIQSLPEIERKIGGEGIVVEVDESKFGKRKYQRGHRVEGVWIVGGVERTDARRMFAVAVENRNAQTLREVIEQHILPGSIVYTDCWRGYRDEDLAELEMQHSTVNHTNFFVDPETGVHTNCIEGTWSGIKIQVPYRHRTRSFVDGHLMSFIWRRRYGGAMWNRFLHALAEIVYDNDLEGQLNDVADGVENVNIDEND